MNSQLSDLNTKRQALEIEAKTISDELTQPCIDKDGKRTKPIGINTPLVDEEGYPRNDIDIYRARDLRKRLSEIQYDHKLIMKQIENKLMSSSSAVTPAASSLTSLSLSNNDVSDEELKARKATKPKPKFDKKTGKWVVCNWDGTVAGIENGDKRSFDKINSEADMEIDKIKDSNDNGNSNHSNELAIERSLASSCKIDEKNHTVAAPVSKVEVSTPFAKINEIFDSSPAARGGLKLYDEIVKIGSVDCTNHRDLKAGADVVRRAFVDGDMIDFVVLREASQLSLQQSESKSKKRITFKIKPGHWEGNGILGCRMVKL